MIMGSLFNNRLWMISLLGGTLSGLYSCWSATNNSMFEDLMRTAVLAAVGTAVSFIVTVILRKLFGKK